LLLILLALLVGLALPAEAQAQRDTTREALERLEELLASRLEDGALNTKEVLPALVVSLEPSFEESRTWYAAAGLATLTRAFGGEGLRVCEGCMAPRTFIGRERIEQSIGAISVEEIVRLDESLRGSASPARAAIWLNETASGVSLRIVDLSTSRIIAAENIDPLLKERARTTKNLTLTRELERRARGDSLTHTFVDFAMFPGQHASLDWTEQWGDTNTNLSGFTLSLYDPVLGVGGAYYRVIPEAFNLMLGGKVIMSVPTAIARSISKKSVNVVDPILSGVFALRVPIARSNYGVFLSASTNGRVGVGISLLNMSVLPVLP
jgi:hypothetical protein